MGSNPLWLMSLSKGEVWAQGELMGTWKHAVRTQWEHEDIFLQAKARGLEHILPSQLLEETNCPGPLLWDI